MQHKRSRFLAKFLLVLLGVVGFCTTHAQEERFRELAIGVRQGYQFSIINFNPGVPQGFNEGITSGLVLQYFSQPQLGFQMEVNYSQRGWNGPEFGQPVVYRKTINYLEIPFLTHFAIGKKSFRIVLNLGSYISFMLNAKNEYFGGVIEPEYYYLVDNPVSYGLMGDLGLALRTKIGVFQLTGRGANGFTDVFSPSNTIFNASPEIFWGGQFSYLYRFGTKKKVEEPIKTETDIDEN